jgi:hypothetical protein
MKTTNYRGYKIEPSGDNFYVTLNGHRAFGEIPATRAIAKKWIDIDIVERRQNEERRAKLKKQLDNK